MGCNTDDTLPFGKSLPQVLLTHLLLNPLSFIGGVQSVHGHVIQKFMTVILQALFCEPGYFFFGISPSSNHPDILFQVLSGLLDNRKNKMIPEGRKEAMHRSWNERSEEVKKGEEETDVGARHLSDVSFFSPEGQ